MDDANGEELISAGADGGVDDLQAGSINHQLVQQLSDDRSCAPMEPRALLGTLKLLDRWALDRCRLVCPEWERLIHGHADELEKQSGHRGFHQLIVRVTHDEYPPSSFSADGYLKRRSPGSTRWQSLEAAGRVAECCPLLQSRLEPLEVEIRSSLRECAPTCFANEPIITCAAPNACLELLLWTDGLPCPPSPPPATPADGSASGGSGNSGGGAGETALGECISLRCLNSMGVPSAIQVLHFLAHLNSAYVRWVHLYVHPPHHPADSELDAGDGSSSYCSSLSDSRSTATAFSSMMAGGRRHGGAIAPFFNPLLRRFFPPSAPPLCVYTHALHCGGGDAAVYHLHLLRVGAHFVRAREVRFRASSDVGSSAPGEGRVIGRGRSKHGEGRDDDEGREGYLRGCGGGLLRLLATSRPLCESMLIWVPGHALTIGQLVDFFSNSIRALRLAVPRIQLLFHPPAVWRSSTHYPFDSPTQPSSGHGRSTGGRHGDGGYPGPACINPLGSGVDQGGRYHSYELTNHHSLEAFRIVLYQASGDNSAEDGARGNKKDWGEGDTVRMIHAAELTFSVKHHEHV